MTEYYQSNRPCKRGHLAPRFRSTRQCSECLKDWRREDARKNRERTYAYQRTHADHLKKMSSEWQRNNPEKIRAKMARYVSRHRAKVLRAGREWRQRNPGKVNAKKARRNATKLQATPAWADSQRIREIYSRASRVSKCLGIAFHVDHVVPLRSDRVSGLHCEANLQILVGRENQRKSNHVWPDM